MWRSISQPHLGATAALWFQNKYYSRFFWATNNLLERVNIQSLHRKEQESLERYPNESASLLNNHANLH